VDPTITTLLVQAATAFANAAAGDAGKRAIGAAWDGLRNIFVRSYGESHPAPVLLDQVKAAPDAATRERAAASLTDLKLTIDPEVNAALDNLSRVLQTSGVTVNTPHAETVYGAQISYGNNTFNFGKCS
jgi:hypothetical protein